MRSVPRLLALLAVLTALVAPVTVAAAGPGPAPAIDPAGDAGHGQPRLSEPANTTVTVNLHANRSATWTVTVAYTLETADERTAFERYADAYRAGETDAGPTADLFRNVAREASAATDRRMRVGNVSRTSRIDDGVGAVTLRFRWSAMLVRTDEQTLQLDDAVLLPGNRTWIGSLEPGQTLVLRTPDGYGVVESDAPAFELRNNSVVIEGPARVEGSLSITYRATDTGGDGGDVPWALVAGAVVVGSVVVGAALYLRRRPGSGPTPTSNGGRPAAGTGEPDRPGGADAGTGTDAEPAAEAGEPPDDTGADAGDGTAGAPETGAGAGPVGGDDGDGDEGESEDDDEVDVELLSDEERVERLLRANGGRMKQASIVEETGWSDAKVSQLLSSMADEDRIDKLRLGRENLISLPGDDG
jgi:hypothetical protein